MPHLLARGTPILSVSQQPSGAYAGSAFSTQPIIHLVNAFGTLRTWDNATVVTASLVGGGSLGGTVTATAVSGVATFSNLQYSGVGPIQLRFTAPLTTSALSTTLVVQDWVQAFLGIGSCVLLLDAISGMVSDGGTHVGSITDLSSSGLAVTLPTAPLFSSTTWNGTQPSLQFSNSAGHKVSVAGLNVPQPFSVITVLQNFDPEGINEYLWCDNSGAPAGMANNPPNTIDCWAQSSSVGWQTSGIKSSTSQGRRIRIDVVNGAASLICRGSTEETGDIGTGDITGFDISRIGLDVTAGIPLVAVFSQALSPAQRASAISLINGRYSGLTLT